MLSTNTGAAPSVLGNFFKSTVKKAVPSLNKGSASDAEISSFMYAKLTVRSISPCALAAKSLKGPNAEA